MLTARVNNLKYRQRPSAFTLIELLVVLAIIAILAAIIFPIYVGATESGRRATSIENMKDIYTATERYRSDHSGKMPEVLFGYAYTSTATSKVVPMEFAADVAKSETPAVAFKYFPGLFPTYIKSVKSFQDPDNLDPDVLKTVSPAVNVLCPDPDDACTGQPDGALVVSKGFIDSKSATPAVPIRHSFYAQDAYDLSPRIYADAGNNRVIRVDETTLVPRYQRSWTAVDDTLKGINVLTPGSGRDDYARQLRVPVAPADTYITCTTYHVPGWLHRKVLVLFVGGNVKVIDPERMLAPGPDVADISAASGKSPANFWKMTP